MCAMDSDGLSTLVKTGPAFCFLMANDTVVEQPLRLENFTATITRHAVSFIERQTSARPFFFFMSYFHVHTPLFTNRHNRGRSRGGKFGDNIEELDDSVGELMAAIDAGGFRERTLVFMTSDNGPYQEEGWENSGRTNIYDSAGHRIGRLRGGKGQLFEGGVRMPGAVVWPGVVAAGSTVDTFVSTMDIMPTVRLSTSTRSCLCYLPQYMRLHVGKLLLRQLQL
jgi:arylsulfatase A-like enzyme